jgi:hypothetical protein
MDDKAIAEVPMAQAFTRRPNPISVCETHSA